MPENPARRASARQVSSGVSPPNSGRSSLLQPIGLTPRRTDIDRSSPRSYGNLTCWNAGLRPSSAACYRLAANRRAEITRMTQQARSILVFDLGGVLIDWDPRHLYRKLFAEDEPAMEHFLATVCTHDWNRCQDAGRSFAEGARLLQSDHPDKAELIDAYGD